MNATVTSLPASTHTVSLSLMDALSQAERLAYANRESSVVVYRTALPVSPAVLAGTACPWAFTIRLRGEPVPEGAELQTTVTRRRGDGGSVYDVVEQVVANLPNGVRLAHRVVLEYCPTTPTYPGATNRRELFAYQFISTEGRNVATWIPSLSVKGTDAAQMQMGSDGRGRLWKNGSIEGESTENIDWLVQMAEDKLAVASESVVSVERPR